MGKTAKIILAIVGVFILACIVGSVVLARFGRQKFTEFAAEAQRQTSEARAWGTRRTQGECLDEGMARVQRCDSLRCQLSVQTFANTCLSVAAPTPGLCAGVPNPQDFVATSQWINARCAAFAGPQSAPSDGAMRCRNLLPVLQRHCVALAISAYDAGPAAAPTAPPTDAP